MNFDAHISSLTFAHQFEISIVDAGGRSIRAVTDGGIIVSFGQCLMDDRCSPFEIHAEAVVALYHALKVPSKIQSIGLEESDLLIDFEGGLSIRMFGSAGYESWRVFQADWGLEVVGCYPGNEVAWRGDGELPWTGWFETR